MDDDGYQLPDSVWGAEFDDLTEEQKREVAEKFGDDCSGDTVIIPMQGVALVVVVNSNGQSMLRIKCSPQTCIDALRMLADGLELDEISGGVTGRNKED